MFIDYTYHFKKIIKKKQILISKIIFAMKTKSEIKQSQFLKDNLIL